MKRLMTAAAAAAAALALSAPAAAETGITATGGATIDNGVATLVSVPSST